MRINPQNTMQNLANLSSTLERLGVAVDEKSADGKQVNAAEARVILDGLDKLPDAEKTAAVDTLTLALQQDLFMVSDDVRAMFAESLNVPVRDLTPNEVLDQAGLQSSRTQFEHSLKVLTKAPRMTKKLMQELFKAMEDAPPFLRAFMTAAVSNASKAGDIKVDSNARAPMRKAIAQENQLGLLDELAEVEAAPVQSAASARLSKLMAEGATFEAILAAFMFMIVSNMQEEMEKKMRELEGIDGELNKRETGAATQRTTDAPGEGVEAPELDIGQTIGDFGGEHAAAAAKVLEKVVNSADTALNRNYESAQVVRDDNGKMVMGKNGKPKLKRTGVHKAGVITRNEAMKIASKLEELTAVGPPADHLIAASMTHALLSAPSLPAGKDSNLGPILEWGQKVLKRYGTDVDIESKLSPTQAQDPSSPLCAALRGAESIPGKLASYIVDVFTNKDTDLGDRMAGLKEASKIVMQHADQQFAADDAKLAEGPQPSGAASATEGVAAANTDGATAAKTSTDGAAGLEGKSDQQVQRSRTLIAEEIKTMAQEMQQMMQAISNILNMLHQNAMNTIRSIR